jgi:LemA protein
LGAYNRTTALRAAILAAWAQIEQALILRAQALTELLLAVASPLASEAAAIEAVASAQTQVLASTEAMRRRPVAQETVAELSKADAVLAAVLVRLVALIEQQPSLLADPAVHGALQVLRELPPRLAFSRQVFNEAASAYNRGTQQFPTRLLKSVLGFLQAGLL